MTAEAGEFAGLTVDEAREAVVARLEEQGLFVKAEDYNHAVSTCYRCGTTIEPLLSLQWFMDMKRLVQPAIAAVEDGRVRFVPGRWGEVYLDWMARHPALVHQPAAVVGASHPGLLLRAVRPSHGGGRRRRPPARSAADRCGHEEDVLDTWFSSALWPFATLGWPEETPRLQTFYPDHGPVHRARHHLPVGGADDHDGAGVQGRRAFQRRHHPSHGARDGRPAHEQEPGHGRRSPRAHRRLRGRRHPFRSRLHELRAGRALQRRAHRDGPEFREQDLERVPTGAAGRPSSGRASGGVGHAGRPLDLQPADRGHRGGRRSLRELRVRRRGPGCSIASSGTSCATGIWRWPRPASTATTRPSACR